MILKTLVKQSWLSKNIKKEYIRKRTDNSPIVAFYPVISRVSLFIFSQKVKAFNFTGLKDAMT
jgi:hypothetical protein